VPVLLINGYKEVTSYLIDSPFSASLNNVNTSVRPQKDASRGSRGGTISSDSIKFKISLLSDLSIEVAFPIIYVFVSSIFNLIVLV